MDGLVEGLAREPAGINGTLVVLLNKFRSADPDNTGVVAMADFLGAFSSLKTPLPQQTLTQLFAEGDVNHTNALDYAQFVHRVMTHGSGNADLQEARITAMRQGGYFQLRGTAPASEAGEWFGQGSALKEGLVGVREPGQTKHKPRYAIVRDSALVYYDVKQHANRKNLHKPAGVVDLVGATVRTVEGVDGGCEVVVGGETWGLVAPSAKRPDDKDTREWQLAVLQGTKGGHKALVDTTVALEEALGWVEDTGEVAVSAFADMTTWRAKCLEESAARARLEEQVRQLSGEVERNNAEIADLKTNQVQLHSTIKGQQYAAAQQADIISERQAALDHVRAKMREVQAESDAKGRRDAEADEWRLRASHMAVACAVMFDSAHTVKKDMVVEVARAKNAKIEELLQHVRELRAKNRELEQTLGEVSQAKAILQKKARVGKGERTRSMKVSRKSKRGVSAEAGDDEGADGDAAANNGLQQGAVDEERARREDAELMVHRAEQSRDQALFEVQNMMKHLSQLMSNKYAGATHKSSLPSHPGHVVVGAPTPTPSNGVGAVPADAPPASARGSEVVSGSGVARVGDIRLRPALIVDDDEFDV